MITWQDGLFIPFGTLASHLLNFAFMEVVLHNSISRLEMKASVFISELSDSDKVNYFIELRAGWFVCNFL